MNFWIRQKKSIQSNFTIVNWWKRDKFFDCNVCIVKIFRVKISMKWHFLSDIIEFKKWKQNKKTGKQISLEGELHCLPKISLFLNINAYTIKQYVTSPQQAVPIFQLGILSQLCVVLCKLNCIKGLLSLQKGYKIMCLLHYSEIVLKEWYKLKEKLNTGGYKSLRNKNIKHPFSYIE